MRLPRRAPIASSLPLSLLLLACGDGPVAPTADPAFEAALAEKADGATTVSSIPIDATFFVPCGNGGSGETLEIQGVLQVATHTSLDAGGGYHFHVTTNPQGVTAVGLVSGNRYQGVGVTSERFNLGAGETYTYINVYRLVARGGAGTYSRHDVTHVTFNANGEVTASVSRTAITCR